MIDIDSQLDAAERRRHRADDRALDRLDRQLDAADRLIVEDEDGCWIKTRNGKRRIDSRLNLISFLIRNRYV